MSGEIEGGRSEGLSENWANIASLNTGCAAAERRRRRKTGGGGGGGGGGRQEEEEGEEVEREKN